MKTKNRKSLTVVLVAAVMPGLSCAMSALLDDDLASVSGQNGLTVSVVEPAAGVDMTSLYWVTNDPNTAIHGEANEAGIRLDTLNLKRLDFSRPLLNFTLDVFSGPAGSTYAGAALSLDLARSRFDIGSITPLPLAGSFGRYVVDSSARLDVVGVNGVLNATNAIYGSSVKLNLNAVDSSLWAVGAMGVTTPGQIYWRQNTSEMTIRDFSFLFDMPDGRIGIDSNGLMLESKPATDIAFSLSMDIALDANTTSPLVNDGNDKPMLYWGWRGHQTNWKLNVGGGGRVDGGLGGLTAGIHFDYKPDFTWIVGEGGSTPFKLEFANWTKLPGNTYSLNLPSLTLDPVSGAEGTTGLCWGSNAISAAANGACSGVGQGSVASNWAAQPLKSRQAADPNALALGVRDMTLSAYSSSVDVIDRTVNPLKAAVRFNWALIYTFANLDADIFISPAADSKSMRLDLALTSQTLGSTATSRWQNGTNFMIGDTDTNFGIGLMGVDVLMATRNASFGITPSGIRIDTSLLRYQMRGMLGGGDIPAMATPQSMAYVDLNMEADRYVLNLGPGGSGSTSFLAYSGFINFANLNTADFANPVPTSGNHQHDDGSYLSLAEPNTSRLGVDIRFANVTGPLEVVNGKVDLQGDSTGGLPSFQLMISNDIKVGTTASTTTAAPCGFSTACTPVAATAPFKIGGLELGGKSLGTIVMPSGIIRAQITLKPQVL